MRKIILKKRLKRLFLIAFSICIVLLFIAHQVVESKTNEFVYTSVAQTPNNTIGLLLGTSKYTKKGKLNAYYSNRISATVELFNANKIKGVLISGDNSRIDYNEPEDMKKDLIKAGIPENKIVLDYAGFSTYESIIRAEKIFDLSNFTIISQDFHARRAVYTAHYLGLNAIAYNAKDVHQYGGFLTKVREKFARIKLFIDLWFEVPPTYSGDKIKIQL